MRKGIALAILLTAAAPIWADNQLPSPRPILNDIRLQLHAEQWLTTKTALVNVNIDAAVNDQGIEKIQANIMQKLAEISGKAEWHILSFDRQQDQSGLEKLQITAQARLDQDALTNLRNKAKSLSIPGETYTIDTIQFTPSEDELRQANMALRNDIYQQAKNEMDALTKMYPDQKYFLHSVIFNPESQPMPVPMVNNTAFITKAAMPMATRAQALTIGDKAELYANVVIASVHEAP